MAVNPERGLAINARASAGALVVTIRDQLARAPKDTLVREILAKQLVDAQVLYQSLLEIEEGYGRG